MTVSPTATLASTASTHSRLADASAMLSQTRGGVRDLNSTYCHADRGVQLSRDNLAEPHSSGQVKLALWLPGMQAKPPFTHRTHPAPLSAQKSTLCIQLADIVVVQTISRFRGRCPPVGTVPG